MGAEHSISCCGNGDSYHERINTDLQETIAETYRQQTKGNDEKKIKQMQKDFVAKL